jgi:hypothetical protein
MKTKKLKEKREVKKKKRLAERLRRARGEAECKHKMLERSESRSQLHFRCFHMTLYFEMG